MSRKHLIIMGSAVLLVLALVLGIRTAVLLWQQAAAKRYRQQMQDPAYLHAQTTRLQPTVERQIRTDFPQVQITPASQPDQHGYTVYQVALPAGDARALPQLQAQLARCYGEYARQGYRARFLIMHNGKVIHSVP